MIFLVRDGEALFVSQVPATGEPRLLNETYSVLHFDESGRIDWPECSVGGARNRALFEALRLSSYDDPDDDPVVQRLRAQLCDELTWLPGRVQRARLHAAARQALQPAT